MNSCIEGFCRGHKIKRRIRFHEPALKALTICIIFVVAGIFLILLPHRVAPK